MRQSRLIILTGPSGVGKTPLDLSLNKFFPEIRQRMKKIILYNSRDPRPGEIDGRDYHFRSEKYLNQLREDKAYLVLDVRGDTQALNLTELKQLLKNYNVFFEGNTYIALKLIDYFKSDRSSELVSIFLSPLSKNEIQLIRKRVKSNSLEYLITILMYKKLERRLRNYGKILTSNRIENIKIRSREAYSELKEAWKFDWIIPNHDGEDSDHWNILPYPIGDAQKSLNTFIDILQKGQSEFAEKWPNNLEI